MKTIKKICLLLVFVLIGLFTFNYTINASSISNNFNGKFVYSIDTSKNYFIYTFPTESTTSKNIMSISDNASLYNTFLTTSNNNLYYRGSLVLNNMKNYILCYNVKIRQITQEDFYLTLQIYELYINANIGQWSANDHNDDLMDLQYEIEFSTLNYDDLFLLIANEIIYIGNYNGTLSGVDAVKRIFDNYVNTSSNALGKYISHLENQAYDNGLLEDVENIPMTIITPILSFFTTFFAIELAPGLSIGYLVLIPLILGVIGIILYFWRKD